MKTHQRDKRFIVVSEIFFGLMIHFMFTDFIVLYSYHKKGKKHFYVSFL